MLIQLILNIKREKQYITTVTLQVIMICQHFHIIAINDKEKIYIKPISFEDKKWDIILCKVCRKRYMFGINKFEKRCKSYTSICLFLYIKSVSCSTVFSS